MARLLIGAMDGQRTVEQLWEMANRRLGERAPTQDEVIELLGQLHAADLLQSDAAPDAAELVERGDKYASAMRRRSYLNPLALRIPLWDPDAWLERAKPWIHRLWSPAGAMVWLAVVLPALGLAGVAPVAIAQGVPAAAPMTHATVDALVARLSAEDAASPFKSFRPTRPPAFDQQCAGNAAESADTKNFAIEYADDTTAQVDLAVRFAVNSDALDAQGRVLLDVAVRALMDPRLSARRFAVAGHTDVSGPRDLNLRLSCARAIAARDYLIARGVSASRVWAYGFGPDRLLGGHAADDPVHRRVELRRSPR
jgi:outer membrane protein OmpA-like peptidoglycan-associated protein